MGVDEFGRHEGEYGYGINPRTGLALPSRPSYFIGLDLGQKQDFTALSILEKHGSGREAYYHCRHLQRFKLGTSYPQIVADVRTLCLKEPLLNAAGNQRP